jgi:hypothetical protein
MANRLTPEQRATAEAYLEVFKPGQATQQVLDDSLVFTRAIQEALAAQRSDGPAHAHHAAPIGDPA